MYVDADYYKSEYGGNIIPSNEIDKRLKVAGRHIDSLTFNRIVGIGFDNLTDFQQSIIKDVICEQAEFEYENESLIDTVLQNYSINGVSMSFGSSWNVYTDKGVAIKRDLFALLSQTGLTTKLIIGGCYGIS